MESAVASEDGVVSREEASKPMSAGTYVAVMLTIIAVCTLVSVPPLFFRKCGKCGARNFLEARKCKSCETPLPDDDG